MNPNPYQDDARHEALSLSPAEKADGFAAVMKRLKGRSEQERAQLRARADAAILGHEAYALGHDNLRRGNHVAAKRWLRVAADHSVPGAEQALEEIETGSADDLARPVTVVVSEDLDPCPAGSSHAGMYKTEKWASLLQWTEAGLAMDAARAEAQQIVAQARRAADELIAKAREDVDRAWADARAKMAAQHRVAAELLHEAERLQQDARLLERNALRAAESVADAPLADVLRDEPQERTRWFTVGFHCQTDALQSEQPQQSLSVKASRAVRTVVAPVDVDAGRLEKLRSSGCSNAIEAGPWWAWNEFTEGCLPTRHSLPESLAQAYETTWHRLPSAAMPRTDLLQLCAAVLRLRSMRYGTAVRPLSDIDLVVGHKVVWLEPERRTTDEATPHASPRNITRGTIAGNEVALPTSNAEDRPDKACLKIFWVDNGEEVDENGAASDVVSVEETAHVAPR